MLTANDLGTIRNLLEVLVEERGNAMSKEQRELIDILTVKVHRERESIISKEENNPSLFGSDVITH